MNKNVRNTSANDDPILQAFEETKGEQLDLLDMVEEEREAEKPKKKRKPPVKNEVQEEVQESVEIQEEAQESEPETEWFTGADGVKYTEEEWAAPVVRNGPSRMEVEEWKERHGTVYFTPFDSEVFVWRRLLRPEYREIIRDTTLNALDREEYFTEKCVLYPRNFSLEKIKKSRAGIASLLSEMIMDKSGFVAQSAPIKL